MIKIKVYTNENDYLDFNITEVTDEVYKILENKVIASVTKNVELQIFLKEASISLPKLMETSVTSEMYYEAIDENINLIRQKKI